MGEYVRDEIDELCNLYCNHERVLACLCVRTHGTTATIRPPTPNLLSAARGFWRKIAAMSMAAGRRSAAICAAMQRLRGVMHICILASAKSPPWINGPQHDSQAANRRERAAHAAF